MAKYKLPPRQQMINLLYVILIAMLAINISSETLNAYSLLNDDSAQRIEKLRTYNQALSDSIARVHPDQGAALQQIHRWSEQLLGHLEDLQREIVRRADQIEEGEPGLIPDKKEDLNSVPYTMLSVATGQGALLKEELGALRDSLCRLTDDTPARQMISAWLTMEDRGFATSWEKGTFSNMSAIGGITYLNLLKENVLLAGATTMKSLSSSVRASSSQKVPAGDSLSSETEAAGSGSFVLVNDKQVTVRSNGTLEQPFISMESREASQIYANYANVITLHAIGSSPEDLRLTAQGGKVTLKGERCTIVPHKNARTVVVSISHRQNGSNRLLAKKTFTVKQLPEAEPYLIYEMNGNRYQCKGNTPLSLGSLLHAKRVGAYIGTPINENIRINGFELVLVKNQSSEVLSARSHSDAISSEQMNILKQAQKGDNIYITSIKAQTPHSTSNLASISIIAY